MTDPQIIPETGGESGYVPDIDWNDGPSAPVAPPAPPRSAAMEGGGPWPEKGPEYAAEEDQTGDSDLAPEEDISSITGAAVLDPPPESRLKNIWREKKLFIILSAVFLLLAVGAIIVFVCVYTTIRPYGDYDKILPNVYCAGVNLGGMTKDEAQTAIEEALRETDYAVTVTLPDGSWEFRPAQEGITLNGAAVARKAYDYGRSDDSAYGVYKAYKAAEKTEHHLTADTALRYSLEDIQNQAVEIFRETELKPTESQAGYDPDTHTVSLTLGTPGRKIEPQTIVDAVSGAFDTLEFSDISLAYETVEIDLEQLKDLTEKSEKTYSSDPVEPEVYADQEAHTIDVTMGQPGYTLNAQKLYDLAMEQVENQNYGTVSLELTEVKPTDVDITDAYKALACEPAEPYYASGSVHEGSYGYTLDWEMAVGAILDAAWGEYLSIPMTEIAPEKTAREIESVLFRDQLSSYSTPHEANAGRTNNLTLACRAIDGTVLNAEETFSFNSVVGQRTAEKGYREATVYVGTDSVSEVGGGICQVASTIYDAVLYADLEVTNRAPHTFFVTYVPGGLDATVYWGSQDFCFRNNTDYPVRIDASVSGGYVNISLYGTKTNSNYVKLDYQRLSTTPYSTVTEYDSSLPSGTSRVTVTPYTGYVYEAYQYVYAGDGTLLETNYLGKSTYKKRDKVITVGTG